MYENVWGYRLKKVGSKPLATEEQKSAGVLANFTCI